MHCQCKRLQLYLGHMLVVMQVVIGLTSKLCDIMTKDGLIGWSSLLKRLAETWRDSL